MTESLPPVSDRDLDENFRATSPSVWEALRGRAVFLTGGTGFVGKWLLECLVHADRQLGLGLALTVLTRNPDAFSRSSPHLAGAGVVRLLEGDVADFAFPPGQFDYVLHAALPVAPPQSASGSLQSMAVEGARRVCEFARAAGARRLLHVSSGAVYGPATDAGGLKETTPWTGGDAVNEYTRAKRLAEAVVGENWPFEVIIARCFAFTGPYLLAASGSAAADFMARASSGRGIVVKGTGNTVRSYQYAGDMARWLLTCMVCGQAGQAYNVGSDVCVTIGELAGQVARLAGSPEPVSFSGQESAGLAGNRYVPDVGRAKSALGLENIVSLEDGILRTLAWHASARVPVTAATVPHSLSSVSHETSI